MTEARSDPKVGFVDDGAEEHSWTPRRCVERPGVSFLLQFRANEQYHGVESSPSCFGDPFPRRRLPNLERRHVQQQEIIKPRESEGQTPDFDTVRTSKQKVVYFLSPHTTEGTSR